jgi:class 3 adenylate cyclase
MSSPSDPIYGDGIAIASRIEALAEPGGIKVSRVVRDRVRDRLPITFADFGEHEVENIAKPGCAVRHVVLDDKRTSQSAGERWFPW